MSDDTQTTDQQDQREAGSTGQQDSTSQDTHRSDDKASETLARVSEERRQARERARQAEARVTELETKQREADAAKAKEDGRYKELLEEREKELVDLKRQLESRDLEARKAAIAEKVGLPKGMVSRIAGTTDDELEADAKALLAFVKPEDAPDTDTGRRTSTKPAQPKTGNLLETYEFGKRLST